MTSSLALGSSVASEEHVRDTNSFCERLSAMRKSQVKKYTQRGTRRAKRIKMDVSRVSKLNREVSAVD